MKYQLILISIWFTTLTLQAQSIKVQDDFEGNGTINTWYGSDCDMNTSFSNPFVEGINQSATVLKYQDKGALNANIRFDTHTNFDLITNHTFSVKVYISSNGITGNQINQVSLKLQDGTLGEPWATQSEIIKPVILDQWQLLTFDFKNDPFVNLDPNSLAPTQRKDFNKVLIQVNGENNNDEVIAYIDDVYYDVVLPADPVYDRLIWSDEFDDNGAVDSDKWFHQTLLPSGGSWYNGELQHYTNRIDNTYVEDGKLKIVAKRESFTDQNVHKNFTSARLNSKFAFTYGKVEISAKLPTGVGTWPALWMLGKNINEDGAYWDLQGFGTTPWPACGEIDIMEHWGRNQNYVQSAMHTPSSYGGTINLGGQLIETASTDFHTYTMIWTSEKIVFSVDDKVHYTYNPSTKDENTWPYNADQYLLLNIAIESNIEASFTKGVMEIDYVRVYQESTTSLQENIQTDQIHIYPNPVQNMLHVELSEERSTIRIYSSNGVLLDNIESESPRLSYDMTHLEQGLYIVEVRSENWAKTFKVVHN